MTRTLLCLIIAGQVATAAYNAFCQPALADPAQWQARPDGYDTFTVFKEWGSDESEWSKPPGQFVMGREEIRACNGVPDEDLAHKIAEFLNQKTKPQ